MIYLIRYTTPSPLFFTTSSDYFVFLSIFGLIFVQLFGGLFEFRFFKLYMLGKLWMSSSNSPVLSRFGAMFIEIWNLEANEVVLKNPVTFFFEKIVSSNPRQISSSPFYERYSKCHSSSWFNWITPVLA